MTEELRIIPFSDPTKKKFKYPIPKELGLDNTFSMILVGSSGSGKTTVIRNLIRILNGKNIKKPNRFIIASTWEDDETLHSKFYKDNVFTEYDDSMVLNLIEMIISENHKRRLKKKREEQYLLVADDMLGLIPRSAVLWSQFVKNRHKKINVMLSVQQFKSLPPVARYNATTYIIFSTINRKELENIDVELNKKFPNELFKEKFLEKITGYDFLYINVKKQLYLVNFTEPLITDEELNNFNMKKGKKSVVEKIKETETVETENTDWTYLKPYKNNL